MQRFITVRFCFYFHALTPVSAVGDKRKLKKYIYTPPPVDANS